MPFPVGRFRNDGCAFRSCSLRLREFSQVSKTRAVGASDLSWGVKLRTKAHKLYTHVIES